MVGMGIGIEYGQDELKLAGAYRINQDPADLLRHLDEVGVRITEKEPKVRHGLGPSVRTLRARSFSQSGS
jgi:hypothetical protein